MKVRKMLIILGVSVLLSGLLLSCETAPAAPFTDAAGQTVSGTATGTASGYGGEVTVTLTVVEGLITTVVATAPHDSPAFAGPVISRAHTDMVRFNTTQIDTVSGSTVTTMGINEAARSALNQILAGE